MAVLGRQLFNIYVNDIAKLPIKSHVLLFTDNTVVVYAHKYFDDVSNITQEDIKNLGNCYNHICGSCLRFMSIYVYNRVDLTKTFLVFYTAESFILGVASS